MLADLKNNYQTNSRASAGELNRIATLLRNMRGEAGVTVGIDRGTGGIVVQGGGTPGGETLAFALKCTLSSREPGEGEGESPIHTVTIAPGYLIAIGGERVTFAGATLDVSANCAIYATWTHATDSTAGAWSDPPFAVGTVPAIDGTQRLCLLAVITDGTLVQHHLGDIEILAIPHVPTSKYQVISSGTGAGTAWQRWISGWVRAH